MSDVRPAFIANVSPNLNSWNRSSNTCCRNDGFWTSIRASTTSSSAIPCKSSADSSLPSNENSLAVNDSICNFPVRPLPKSRSTRMPESSSIDCGMKRLGSFSTMVLDDCSSCSTLPKPIEIVLLSAFFVLVAKHSSSSKARNQP